MDPLALVLSLAGLLILSGTFSGAETALFSIPGHRLREMEKSRRPGERAVAAAMNRPRRILVTILLGNMVVNILASAIGAAAAIRLTGSVGLGVTVATIAMTTLILLFGEMLPKTLAYLHAETIARTVARPLLGLGRVLSPLGVPLLRVTEMILGRETDMEERVELAEALAMLRLAHAEGEVGAHERDLIEGVIELGTSPLREVMTPRTEIFAIAASTPVSEAREMARSSNFSKFPVASEEPDEMMGYVTAVDLLLAKDEGTAGDLAHSAAYVPEVKPALDLLDELRRSGDRLAFVVDEHGHLAGLVTITDLLEEVSGEIIEGADLHKVLYETIEKDRVVIPGRMEIRFFNEEFGTSLAGRNVETIAGLILEEIGRIPEAGESFTIDGVSFLIAKAEPHRIDRVEVRLTGEAPSEEEESR